MSIIEQIEVGDKSYAVTQATAIKQLELVSMLGPVVFANSAVSAAQGNGDISHEMVKGVLLSAGSATLDKVGKIVLWKCAETGGERLITISDFQGQINAYLDLLSHAVMANLSDFFTWCDAENAATQNTAKQPSHTSQ